MVITYETFLDISNKLDKNTIILDESVMTIMNDIKKHLNISVKEVLKKTIVNKKEDISQIFKLLTCIFIF